MTKKELLRNLEVFTDDVPIKFYQLVVDSSPKFVFDNTWRLVNEDGKYIEHSIMQKVKEVIDVYIQQLKDARINQTSILNDIIGYKILALIELKERISKLTA